MSFKYQRYGFEKEKDFIEKLTELCNNGVSQREIARILGCSRLTVIKAFKHYKLSPTNHDALFRKCEFETEDDMRKEFKNLYESGLSQREIAERFNVSIIPVSKHLEKCGVKKRDNSEAIGVRQKDVELTEEENSIINGALLGNGFLLRKKYTALLKYMCWHKEAIETIAQKLHRLGANYRFRRKPEKNLYELKTMAYRCLASLHDKWHEENIKVVPEDLSLSPETCYWWYVGDGHTTAEAIKLISCFSSSGMDKIINKMPIKAQWYLVRNRYPTVYIPELKDRIKFLEYIGPCRHKAYAYKWKVYGAGNKLVVDLFNSNSYS